MSQGERPTIEDLTATIRSIPDFPKPGILFRDITPLLANGPAFKAAVDAMSAPFERIVHVVSIESRGFIFGAPIAGSISFDADRSGRYVPRAFLIAVGSGLGPLSPTVPPRKVRAAPLRVGAARGVLRAQERVDLFQCVGDLVEIDLGVVVGEASEA